MNTIRVSIDSKHGEISIFNNGKGIPIQLHKKEGKKIFFEKKMFLLLNFCAKFTIKKYFQQLFFF